ncbi:MAG: hypothetical protein J5921_05450 [Clostridia bacterium]|nr:hypothetical protein [Clostridia bacterium]
MVIIQTALYLEAKTPIEYLKLREAKNVPLPVRLFCSDDKRFAAVVTGTGSLNACAGTAAALTYLGAGRGDLFINFGIAGAADDCGLCIGDIARCVKCTAEGERPFYPDITFGSRFKLAEIETVKKVTDISSDGCLPKAADMELYHAFSAANMFLGPESLISYKVISDYTVKTAENGGRLDEKAVETLVSAVWQKLLPEIEKVSEEASSAFEKTVRELPAEVLSLYEKVCEKLSLSYSNREILKNKLWKDFLIGVSVKDRLYEVLGVSEDELPKDKKGREAFLKERLLCESGGDNP